MTLIKEHTMLTRHLVPNKIQQVGSGSAGSTYTFNFNVLPRKNSLLVCLVGGAQGRAIISITGAGSNWNNLNDGNKNVGFAWKMCDGVTETIGPIVVTMISSQTGVCYILEFANAGVIQNVSLVDYTATTSVANTYLHDYTQLEITAHSTNATDTTWGNVNNGFQDLQNPNYLRTAWKNVIGKATETVTWSGSNARTGGSLVLGFRAVRKNYYQ